MKEAEKALRKKRVRAMIRILKKLFSSEQMTTALQYATPWQLLVAVILSAQCTDKRVNQVTPALFARYPDVMAMASARASSVEKLIFSTGFYKNKTNNIIKAAQVIQQLHKGTVPSTMEELIGIPGVARKTANVVLANAFNKVEGIAVDTHVRRLAIRFNLSDSTNPVMIERDLLAIVPKKEWKHFADYCILYGRTICPARKHHCENHPLTQIYPQAAHQWPPAR